MATDPSGIEHFRHAYTKDRGELLNRLRRIEGQVRAIARLVDEEAYCLDILQQVEAMTSAADGVGLLLLEDHINVCLAHAVETGQGKPYLDEVMTVVRRALGRRSARPKGPRAQV
jgi:DNA-binding FrmR family transcriptional regulator